MRLPRRLLGSLITAIAVVAAGAPGSASPAVVGCAPGWTSVPTPERSTYDSYAAVAGTGPHDVWAVGDGIAGNGRRFVTLTGHWDGRAWSRVPSPTLERGSALFSVAAVAPGDVWAVGTYRHPVGHAVQIRTLIEHWDGHRWRVVASPSPGPLYNYLNGIHAVGPSEVWAVGFRDAGLGYVALILRWDGSAWKEVRAADPDPSDNFLEAVSGTGSNDLWAAGLQGQNPHHTLVEHWNGKHWSAVSSPDGGTGDNWLLGVAAASPVEAWAVGYVGPEGQAGQTPLLERWDGSSWAVASTPDIGDGRLMAVSASSPGGALAVGTTTEPDGETTQTLVERWDGSSWAVEPSPSPENFRNELQGVIDPAGSHPWAVGFAETRVGIAHPLALRRCGNESAGRPAPWTR